MEHETQSHIHFHEQFNLVHIWHALTKDCPTCSRTASHDPHTSASLYNSKREFTWYKRRVVMHNYINFIFYSSWYKVWSNQFLQFTTQTIWLIASVWNIPFISSAIFSHKAISHLALHKAELFRALHISSEILSMLLC